MVSFDARMLSWEAVAVGLLMGKVGLEHAELWPLVTLLLVLLGILGFCFMDFFSCRSNSSIMERNNGPPIL